MTDDLVKRLRTMCEPGGILECRDIYPNDIEEAADEIDRLREALRAMTYAYSYGVPCFDWEPKARAHSLARAALSSPAKDEPK